MLGLLQLPIVLLRVAFFSVKGFLDALAGRNRLRSEFTVSIDAPREKVWQFVTDDHMVLDGPPAIETFSELLPDNLRLTRIFVNGQQQSQNVSRDIERDDDKGVFRARLIDHPLSKPPEDGRDVESGIIVASTPAGTTLTLYNELTVRYFHDRINYAFAPRQTAYQIKYQCEKAAGTFSQSAVLANQGWLLSVAALLSFCYLFGWKEGLLLTVVIVLHELGHALAMLMAGVGIRGIYLIPFFGGAAVPKTAYRTAGRLGFIALMGPAFSLIPTLAVFAMFRATGNIELRKAAEMFAVINVANLLPLYPLDGGQILHAIAGSVSQRAAAVAGWIGILAGLGLAIYLQSLLIGIPFLLFALQRYLSGGRTMELEPLSLRSGIALTLASIATVVLYAVIIHAGRTFRF
jgi:Zn-dependent protease